MIYSSIPKKLNTAFIKALVTKYPNIKLDFGRKEGYSVYLTERPNKRWMMIDMNDNSSTYTPHLIIVVDTKKEEFHEEQLESLLNLPKKEDRSVQTSFRINKNRDAVHLYFYEDAFNNFDFERSGFYKFLELAYISFKSR